MSTRSARLPGAAPGRFCIPVVALSLAACAPVAPRPETAPTLSATPVERFELAGRVAVKHDGQGFSGGVRWQHAPAGDLLWFTSPLGQSVARLTRDADGVTLVDSQDRSYRAPDAETLTRETLGWQLPLAGLRYWVVGRPSPVGVPTARFDGGGRLVDLVQDGWQVEFLRYAPDSGLPSRLNLRYGNLEIKLVVDTWTLGAPR